MTCMLHAVLRALVSLFWGAGRFCRTSIIQTQNLKKIQEAERGQGQRKSVMQ